MNFLTRTFLIGVACSSIMAPREIPAGELEEAVQQNLTKLVETKSCRDCNLQGVNLNRADLSGGDLQGADLTGAKLYLCNMSGANLRDAILRNTGFGGADLADADLRGADLTGTSLGGAYIEGAKFDHQELAEDGDEIDLESIIASGRAGSPLAAVEYAEIEQEIIENTSESQMIDPIGELGGGHDPAIQIVKGRKKVAGLIAASKAAPNPKRVVPIKRVVIE